MVKSLPFNAPANKQTGDRFLSPMRHLALDAALNQNILAKEAVFMLCYAKSGEKDLL